MSWIVAVLAIIGAVLELVGLWWTVQDLTKAAKALRQYDAQGENVWLAPFPAHARSGGSATLSGGSEPSVETRLSLIEAEVRDLPDRLARLEDQLREEWQGTIRVAVEATHNTVNGRITRLREYVLSDRRISTSERWWRGPLAVFVGIVFSCGSDLFGAFR